MRSGADQSRANRSETAPGGARTRSPAGPAPPARHGQAPGPPPATPTPSSCGRRLGVAALRTWQRGRHRGGNHVERGQVKPRSGAEGAGWARHVTTLTSPRRRGRQLLSLEGAGRGRGGGAGVGLPAEGATPAVRSTGHPRSMAGRGAGGGPQPSAVAQPLTGGHLYPFVSTESEGAEEEGELSELRPRGREKVRRSASRDRLDDIVLLTKDIREGDTLNAIALQFCCSVSARARGPRGRSRAGCARRQRVVSQKWKIMSGVFVLQRRVPVPWAFPLKTNISVRVHGFGCDTLRVLQSKLFSRHRSAHLVPFSLLGWGTGVNYLQGLCGALIPSK